ncbi:hypothetical protein D9M68_846160 [compost metagenome]
MQSLILDLLQPAAAAIKGGLVHGRRSSTRRLERLGRYLDRRSGSRLRQLGLDKVRPPRKRAEVEFAVRLGVRSIPASNHSGRRVEPLDLCGDRTEAPAKFIGCLSAGPVGVGPDHDFAAAQGLKVDRGKAVGAARPGRHNRAHTRRRICGNEARSSHRGFLAFDNNDLRFGVRRELVESEQRPR